VTVTRASLGLEPCELWGTPVQLLEFETMRAMLTGEPAPAAPVRIWYETGHEESRPGSITLAFRPHTPQLCTEARNR
jgi:hypothetical protein